MMQVRRIDAIRFPSPPSTMAAADRLVRSCLLFLSSALEVESDDMAHDTSLHRAYGRLIVWFSDFDSEVGKLDEVLDYSKFLKEPTVSRISDISECLFRLQYSKSSERAVR
jgi:hypothetical protein